MPIKCGGSNHSHHTVDQVRACQIGGVSAEPPERAPTQNDWAIAQSEVEEGMWWVDKKVYKVQVAHHGSGKKYVKLLTPVEPGWGDNNTGNWIAEWTVIPGFIIQILRRGKRMTLEEATEFGALYGFCVRCGRILTKESSIAQAMGDKCAGKF